MGALDIKLSQRPSPSLLLVVAASCLAVGLGACGRGQDDVRHYSVPKAPAPEAAPDGPAATPAQAGSSLAPPPAAPALAWTTPEGWTAGAGSSMRLASFVVPLPSGIEGKGDASIVHLPGNAGGLVANINRWRGQVGLPPASPEEIEAAARPGKAPLGDFRAFTIVNPDKGQGMLAAIFSDDAGTTFVKLKAPASAIAALEPAFTALCQSLTTQESP